MDPHTGEILAMVSGPTFDPNDFAVHVSRDQWNKLVADPDKPLLNKAIQAQLAPGSTFKIIMSVAGWQEGIAQTLHVNCTGGAEFYGRRFGCWVKGGHGPVDARESDLPVLRRFFLHAGGKTGHRAHRKVRDRSWVWAEDGNRSAQRSERRYAVGRMEDQELQAEMVCRRNHFGRHRSGCGCDYAGAVVARDQRRSRMGGRMVRAARDQSARICRRGTSRRRTIPKSRTSRLIRRVGSSSPTRWRGCLLPGGTAAFAAYSRGSILRARRASAQIVSLTTRAKFKNSEDLAQNGWFVGIHATAQSGHRCLCDCSRAASTAGWRRVWRRK